MDFLPLSLGKPIKVEHVEACLLKILLIMMDFSTSGFLYRWGFNDNRCK